MGMFFGCMPNSRVLECLNRVHAVYYRLNNLGHLISQIMHHIKPKERMTFERRT
jgi:hypothetical protein